jgi:hypothetical protein
LVELARRRRLKDDVAVVVVRLEERGVQDRR